MDCYMNYQIDRYLDKSEELDALRDQKESFIREEIDATIVRALSERAHDEIKEIYLDLLECIDEDFLDYFDNTFYIKAYALGRV